MHDNGVTLQKKVLQNLDIPYSYELAKRMEQYRSHPTLGYRPAGSKAEFETGEMLKTEMEKIGLSEVTKDAVTVDGWEFHKAALSYTNAAGETVSAELGAYQTTFVTDGPKEFSMMYLGKGTETDYQGKDVRDKLVLVEINQRDEWWINYPVYQAHLKGAAALIAVQSGGYGEIDDEALNAQDIAGPEDAPAFSISRKDAAGLLELLREVEDEEPLLGVEFSEELQRVNVQVMGEVQLEVLQAVLRERYGAEVSFGPCGVLYRETIANAVVGCGHFEPLRHYAEVHLRLSPGAPGSGITFDSECHTDVLAQNWQNLIRTHVLEKSHRGVLTGAPLTDVRVTLLAGRAHLKHTEGGDFRQAVYRAVRQGLMQAESVLLEPWYSFTAEADAALAGRILSDIPRMGGRYEAPVTGRNGRVAVTGTCPVAQMQAYARELTALGKGRTQLSLAFEAYHPCTPAQQQYLAEQTGYDPERDVENTPDSVFCSHGAGYPVKWNEAPAQMHIQLK